MFFLIVGLGSMGKRRIRSLKALNAGKIIGFDPRTDRCEEVKEKYSVDTYTDFDEAMGNNPEVLIISTPPDLHMYYAHIAADAGKHFFTEAGVMDNGMSELISKLEDKGIVGVPSCTNRFYQGPKHIKNLINQGRIGQPLSFTYHCGQYLPDWHPWEDYRSFYVSNDETGACREIVPFELVWLTWAFGDVASISCMKERTGILENKIDDVYQILMKFQCGSLGHLMVDVISRPAVKYMRIMGTEGIIEWINTQNIIRVSKVADYSWETIDLSVGTVESNYLNPEEPYIEEMNCFIEAIDGVGDYDYTYKEDSKILNILYSAESSSEGNKHVVIG